MLFKIKFTYFKMREQIDGIIIIRYLDISFQFREADGNNVIAFKMNMLNIGFNFSTWNCLNLAFCIWQQC